jgi:hypothetical protein
MTAAYKAYAPPLVFGPWVTISEQVNGPITYSISAQPLGATKVIGEIRYWDESGELHTDSFFDMTRITTENSTQRIKVRFKSLSVLGSEVRVMVTSVLH